VHEAFRDFAALIAPPSTLKRRSNP
jgi:hypothetical protein